jgi:hypothetical protein
MLKVCLKNKHHGGGTCRTTESQSEGDQGEPPEGISQPVDPDGVGGLLSSSDASDFFSSPFQKEVHLNPFVKTSLADSWNVNEQHVNEQHVNEQHVNEQHVNEPVEECVNY